LGQALEQARSAGATDVIDKPTEVERIRKVIDAALRPESIETSPRIQQPG
jgi:FixJ family two-component response regulator